MAEPKLDVPAEVRELAEKTIEQAEKAFGMFFDAASRSISAVPGAGSEISKQALTLTEQNMRAAFEHARKLVQATDFQEAVRLQSEFLRSQFTNAGEHMRQISAGGWRPAGKAPKGRFELPKIRLTRRANQWHIPIVARSIEPAPETAAGFVCALNTSSKPRCAVAG